MRVPVLFTGEETRKGEKNGKPWEMTEVTAVDMSDGHRCATPIVFTLDKQDAQHLGKLRDQRGVVDVTKLGVYNGRLDISARIVAVGDGKKAHG